MSADSKQYKFMLEFIKIYFKGDVHFIIIYLVIDMHLIFLNTDGEDDEAEIEDGWT